MALSEEIASRFRLHAMEYEKAISRLNSLQSTNIKLGLERIAAACAVFGNPERKFPSIIVAGTNGKGSTSAFLESIFRHLPSPLMPVRQSFGGEEGQGEGDQGGNFKVGLFTSPHLTDVRERIQIDRKMISKRDFAGIVEQLAPPFSKGGEGGFSDKQLTYFEFLTLMAFLYFAQQNVDVAILEVGLGGRFDATNVVTPLASVITRIGLDHQKYLGATIEKIAFEKAGIIKEGVPVITIDQDQAVMNVIRGVAEERHAMLHVVSPHEVKYKLGLLGNHQNENAALAMRAFDIVTPSLSLPPRGGGLGRGGDIVRAALASTRWPGRLEVISKEPLVILDGAHNPNGAAALARFLKNPPLPPFKKGGRIIVLFGAMEDKDIEGIIAPLIPVVDEWVITRPKTERAAKTEKVREIVNSQIRKFVKTQNNNGEFPNFRISEFPDVRAAIKQTLATISKNDTLIITGSLYMVAEAREYFGNSL